MGSALTNASHAGRPLFTDDASVTESDSCQIESWMQFSDAVRESWIVPACNPFGNLEISVAMAEINPESGSTSQVYAVQGKSILLPIPDQGVGVGLAFGVAHDAESDATDVYGYVPLSLALPHEPLSAHVNLGWYRNDAEHAHHATWAIAAVYRFTEQVTGFAESLGDHRSDPMFHAGFSYALVPGRVNLDATYGRDTDADADRSFGSLGISLYFPR